MADLKWVLHADSKRELDMFVKQNGLAPSQVLWCQRPTMARGWGAGRLANMKVATAPGVHLANEACRETMDGLFRQGWRP